MNKVKLTDSIFLIPVLPFIGLLASGFYNTYFVDFEVDVPDFAFNRIETELAPSKRGSRISYRQRAQSRVEATSAFERSDRVQAVEENSDAEIQKNLDLTLVEFFNSKHFDEVLRGDSIEGHVETNGGVIESMEINLPDGTEIIVEGFKMNGNQFNYTLDGEIYSGILYQAGNNGYSATLVNGPYEGSKMKFAENERSISADQIIEDKKIKKEESENIAESDFEKIEENFSDNDLDDEVDENEKFIDDELIES